MNLIEKATIIHYHRHRIAEHEDGTVKSLGWKGEESQLKRFQVIADSGDFNNCSVLDVGCGYGDLKKYMDGMFQNFTYIGIDQMPEFISKAKILYKDYPDTHFLTADFATTGLPLVDYVVASGAFGYRSSNPDFYFEMISRLYKASKKTFVFNMLDKDHFPDHPLLTGHNRNTVEDYCNSHCNNIKVIDGYLKDDFTVVMCH